MALKDWKKDKIFENNWYNRNQNIKIEIIKNAGSRFGIVSKTTYDVVINDVTKKHNLKKSQALKFARQYMRTH